MYTKQCYFQLIVPANPVASYSIRVDSSQMSLKDIFDSIPKDAIKCTVVITKIRRVNESATRDINYMPTPSKNILNKYMSFLIELHYILTLNNRWVANLYFDLMDVDRDYLRYKQIKITNSYLRRFGFLNRNGLWYYRFHQIGENQYIFYESTNIEEFKLIKFEWFCLNSKDPENKNTGMKVYKPVGSTDFKRALSI